MKPLTELAQSESHCRQVMNEILGKLPTLCPISIHSANDSNLVEWVKMDYVKIQVDDTYVTIWQNGQFDIYTDDISVMLNPFKLVALLTELGYEPVKAT